jgi:hypothetical protein
MLVIAVIDPLDELVPATDEEIGVGALAELSFGRRLDDDVGLGEQVAHHFDHVVEVVLDDVVLALVLGGDHRRDDSLGDLVDVVGGDVHRIDDVGNRFIDSPDELVPATDEEIGVGALVEFVHWQRRG